MKIKLLITGGKISMAWDNKIHTICYGADYPTHWANRWSSNLNKPRFRKWRIEPL